MENAKVVLSAKLTTYGMPIYKNSAELEVSKIYLHSMWKKLKKKLDHLVNAMWYKRKPEIAGYMLFGSQKSQKNTRHGE